VKAGEAGMKQAMILGCAAMLGLALATRTAAAEDIKIGLIKVASAGPIVIAQAKGYFAKEGLTADIVFADQPALLAQGVMAGDFTFAVGAATSAFYNLAGRGALRIISGTSDEAPGFKAQVVIVSNQAYAAGLKTLRDLAGHSSAISAAGAPQQYELGVIAQKYGFDYASIRTIPLGSFPNMVTAVVGGSVDSAIPTGAAARQAITDNKVQRLAWVGDEMRVTLGVLMTSAATADRKADIVNRFLRVYRAGVRDYRAAFIGPDERPKDNQSAAETYAILAKYFGQPVEYVMQNVSHLDAQGRLDVQDIHRQIDWYKSQGMVKPEVDASKIIDMRYVVPLPEK